MHRKRLYKAAVALLLFLALTVLGAAVMIARTS